MMKVLEHEHPLKLVDLKVIKNEESDEEEEEKDHVPQDEFVCPCNRCGQEINDYYRYNYKCSLDDNSCDYSLHKFCAELPATLHHMSHPHPLELHEIPYKWKCEYCKRKHNANEVGYRCSSDDCSMLFVDVICAVEAKSRMIHHPSHPHPLVSLTTNPILCECRACGKEHKGIFFQCTTCSDFAIHIECAFLPKTLLIQRTTNDVFHHTHPLTLSYSFSKAEQSANYYQTCRVCGENFADDYNLWLYKCDKCMYYAHLDCATSRKEPFMSMLSSASWGLTIKNFKDADYRDLLHLPFPDQSCTILKHLFFKKVRPAATNDDEVSLQHINHQHELILVDTSEHIGSTMCHNPMKKIQLLCNVCVQPIMEAPYFHKCGDESCNFALHQWCTWLPKQIDNHPGHPQHTLVLLSNVPGVFFSIFKCALCTLRCNGFSYGCVECGYYIDVKCGFIPEKITHKSHPNHLLLLGASGSSRSRQYCYICKWFFKDDTESYYSCNVCDVYIHRECALFLPETVTHIYDKHPMHLSHLPIENHTSEYFCEICEHGLIPYLPFYHCDECAQSVHSACFPLILQSETETYSKDPDLTFYRFLNVKFGSIHKTDGHPHPLSFAQGIESDGECSMCKEPLRYKMIFKCLECKFAIDYKCCKRMKIT
ncbi:hypothetical protein SSX86_026445 [Deinandra increscens subsp. villosa]|uniref:Phorbol-ester/DAG-type domain-containing protein n=1 Tax=Deinandra increscens subsp. villosa TaxID=3103831 RepID=A0AAP0GNZ3_9ASTR